MAGQIDGLSLGVFAIGAGVAFAGVAGKSIPSLIQAVIQGKSPAAATAANPINTSSVSTAATVTASGGSDSYDSSSALQALWTKNGGAQDTAAFAAAVATAESGGSATVTSPNPDGGTNVGIFQLDTKGVGAGYSVAQLQNPNTNTQITVLATNNGTDWSEWSDSVVNDLPGHQYTPGSAIP